MPFLLLGSFSRAPSPLPEAKLLLYRSRVDFSANVVSSRCTWTYSRVVKGQLHLAADSPGIVLYFRLELSQIKITKDSGTVKKVLLFAENCGGGGWGFFFFFLFFLIAGTLLARYLAS